VNVDEEKGKGGELKRTMMKVKPGDVAKGLKAAPLWLAGEKLRTRSM
jgi:hypothetical protein